MMRKNQLLPSFSILLLLLLAAFLISLSVGYANSSFSELLDLIRGQADSSTLLIIGRIRLPRILASMIGGASLALAGLLLQTLTRNPLAHSGRTFIHYPSRFASLYPPLCHAGGRLDHLSSLLAGP